MLLTFACYLLAAAAALGLARFLWKPLILIASVASAIVLMLFVTPWTLAGIAIDAVLLWATLVQGWRQTPFFGRARHVSPASQGVSR